MHSYYRENYAGLTRGEFERTAVCTSASGRKGNWIDPVKQVQRRIKNALAYYREHYAGLTRGQLKPRQGPLRNTAHSRLTGTNTTEKGQKISQLDRILADSLALIVAIDLSSQ